jgi:hypothetical protein
VAFEDDASTVAVPHSYPYFKAVRKCRFNFKAARSAVAELREAGGGGESASWGAEQPLGSWAVGECAEMR